MKTRGALVAALVCATLGLTGCGGGSRDSGSSIEVYRRQTSEYTLAGNISGLEGTATLTANGRTVSVSQNGAFQFDGTYTSDSTIRLSVTASPFRQICTLLSADSFTINENINISVNCSPLGQLRGLVKNYHTGEAIQGATLRLVASDANEIIPIENVTSDASGAFVINGIGVSTRFTLTASSPDHGTQSTILFNSRSQPDIDAEPLLLLADVNSTFDCNSAQSLGVNGITLVTLPANAFVDKNGNPCSGPVRATLTIIDPSADPSLMPGSYQARRPVTGEIAQIQSFGAVDYEFRDQNGDRLQLAEGKTATISIPLASSVDPTSAPDTVPLFYFDTQSGFWLEEGSATLTDTGTGHVYRGTVS
ncbi:MAG TPA: carboxypeptidase-like regulatory domain-containing protein, partial [Dongiaceae bacterium]|nr:carboxypeptidase-like regulatory domain-containing protein [Dongiaceae bacterium]